MRNFVLLLLFFSGLCFGQKKDIIKVMLQQQTAWNSGDLEGFMQGYWKSDSLLFIGSKSPNYGWQTTLDNYKKSYPNKEKLGTLEFSDLQVKPLGKNYAQVLGKWKLKRATDEPSGIFTLIFQKFRDGWKIISDHTN